MADELTETKCVDLSFAAQTKQNLIEHDVYTSLMLQNVVVSDKVIGLGQFGTAVHEAKFCGAICAAKHPYPKLVSNSPGSLSEHFTTECLTWAKMKHPHVVLLLGLSLPSTASLPVLVMEKMDISLQQLLSDCLRQPSSCRRLSLSQKTFILLQVALGLAYIHQVNPPAIHGNLTASNVLVALPSLTTKISDYGMARVIESAGMSLSQANLPYAAPELEDDGPLPESDTFSFGVLIIHTIKLQLSRLLPIRAKQGKSVITRTDFERWANDIEEFADDEKALFVGVIEKCLEFDPEDRPNSLALVTNLEDVSSKVDPVHDLFTGVLAQLPCTEMFDNNTSSSTPTNEPSNLLPPLTFNDIDVKQRIGCAEKRLHGITAQLKIKNDELAQRKSHLDDLKGAISVNNQEIMICNKLTNGYKDLGPDCLKWEPLQTMECLKGWSLACNNLTQCNGIVSALVYSSQPPAIAMAQFAIDAEMQVKVTLAKTQNIPKHLGVHNGQFCPLLYQAAMASLNGYVNVIGGSPLNPNIARHKDCSNKVLSLPLPSDSLSPTWQDIYPPVKQMSNEYIALTYKHAIVVVHKMGNIELLNTSNDNPVWKELEPSPFSLTEKPSAVVVGSYLIVWLGTLYCTNLDDILSQLQSSTNDSTCTPSQVTVHVSWSTIPSPPNAKHSTAICLMSLNLQLIAMFDEHAAFFSAQKQERVFAFSCSSGQWMCINEQGLGSHSTGTTCAVSVGETVILSVWQYPGGYIPLQFCAGSLTGF